jgi:DNA-binding NtrC family response regulator
MSHRAPQSEMKLLIVDDDRSIRSMVSQTATIWGYETEECASAEQALERLAKTRFNIVLTDIRMGKMDGIAFAERIRETLPSTAVVIMTGFPSAKTVQKSQAMGAIYYMQKPINNDELGDTLKLAASWNIGMLVDRATKRFLALRKGDDRDKEARMKAIKNEIRHYMQIPGRMPALRDFVYLTNFEDNALFQNLKGRFSTDSVKPF